MVNTYDYVIFWKVLRVVVGDLLRDNKKDQKAKKQISRILDSFVDFLLNTYEYLQRTVKCLSAKMSLKLVAFKK